MSPILSGGASPPDSTAPATPSTAILPPDYPLVLANYQQLAQTADIAGATLLAGAEAPDGLYRVTAAVTINGVGATLTIASIVVNSGVAAPLAMLRASLAGGTVVGTTDGASAGPDFGVMLIRGDGATAITLDVTTVPGTGSYDITAIVERLE